jgi:hypothetical protein
MKYLLFLCLAAAPAWAYVMPPDTVLIAGRILLTPSRPLDSYPWPGEPPKLSEYPTEGASDARQQVALWEIRDGRLYLLAIRAFRFGAFAPARTVGLRDLMAERIQDGRVFADWYTGEFVVLEEARVDPLLPSSERNGPPVRVSSYKLRIVRGQVVENLPNELLLPNAPATPAPHAAPDDGRGGS